MAVPVGAYGRATTTPGTQKTTRSARRSAARSAESFTRNRGAQQAYLNQLNDFLYGGGGGGFGGGGGRGGRRGGGGGGGGGGGPSAYERFQIEEEKRRRRELEARKLQLTQGLQGARRQAIPLLNQYSRQYGKDIGTVFGQNRALNRGYSNQLNTIARQMSQGTRGQQASLRRDLQGQGAGSPELQAILAAANQNVAGTNFLNQNAQGFNTRLAQAMAMAQADARTAGAGIKASSLGQLENSYANLLAQIGMIGLQ